MFSPKMSTDHNFLLDRSLFHLKISDFFCRFSSNFHNSNSVLEGSYSFYNSQTKLFIVVIHRLVSNSIALNVPHLDFSDSGKWFGLNMFLIFDLSWNCHQGKQEVQLVMLYFTMVICTHASEWKSTVLLPKGQQIQIGQRILFLLIAGD